MSKNRSYVIGSISIAVAVVFLIITIMWYIGLQEELKKPKVLVDETKYITFGEFFSVSTVFSEGEKVNVEIKVVEGGPLDVLLFDSKGFLEFERFMKNEINSVSYLKTGSALNVKSKNYEFTIPTQDRYFIVVNNAGGIEGGARPVGDVSVHIKVTYVIP
jgi:hypothetical protein